MNTFWQGKRVLVTGGAGFIGSFVVDNLIQKRGVPPENIVVPRSRDCDLRVFENCQRAVAGCHIVIHLAASTGGISFSRAHPASQYYDCMLMNLHLFEAARRAGVEKLVAIGNILVYPAKAPSPLEEEMLHEGKVAETHLGIGMAKRDMVVMCEMYHKEFGLNAVTVLAANAYGPRDRFDPEVSHVIPATIVKCHTQDKLVVWGDGKPTRDFLYVADVAEGILLAAERLEPPNYYVNIASGEEISIGDLARLIARLCDFEGEIIFDLTKTGGDPRRSASSKKARELLGFSPQVSLEEGLRRTIAWYREQVKSGNLATLMGH
jgi:GDP-L-fucose synthase